MVVADEHAFTRVLISHHVARDGMRDNARVRKSEIFRDNTAPAVGSKLD